MAKRRTIHVLKNNQVNAGALPSSGIQMGEPLVNLYNGILFFSGVTGGNYVQSDNNVGYFEVGSNLYNLELRNKITRYQNTTALAGKFLSGTTTGFVLADIASIAGSVDSYVTGTTWNPNQLTLTFNQGKPSLSVSIDTFSGLTLYGTTLVNGNLTVTGTTNLNGSSNYNQTITGTNPFEIANVGFVTAYTQSNDTYVTGFTYDNANTLTITRNQGKPTLTTNINTLASITVNGNLTVTGQTTTKDLLVSQYVLGNLIPNTGCTYDLGSSTNRWDEAWLNKVKIGTCTTTLEDDNSQFIISVGGTSSGVTFNLNGGDLNISGDALPTSNLAYSLGSTSLRWIGVFANNLDVTGITVSNLSPGKVVYVGSSNELKTETGFEYDDSTNRMQVGAITVNNALGTNAVIGQGGLIIGSGGSFSSVGIGDLVVHGNLTIFGTGTTVATSELYVEDPQITLNYNPSGSTAITSIASGFRIQDGNGLSSGSTDVYLTIAQMNTFTGGDVTEYTGATGYSNRAFLTQLNDIVIRNTNFNNGAPDGVRILAEFDTLDGGTY